MPTLLEKTQIQDTTLKGLNEWTKIYSEVGNRRSKYMATVLNGALIGQVFNSFNG